MVYKVTIKKGYSYILYIDAKHITPHIRQAGIVAGDFTERLKVIKRLVPDVVVTDWEMIEDSDVPVGAALYVPWTVGAALKSHSPLTKSEAEQVAHIEAEYGTATNPLRASGTITEIAERVKAGLSGHRQMHSHLLTTC
jgi:hypothetical protein